MIELVGQRAARDPEQARRLGLVAVGLGQRVLDRLALDVVGAVAKRVQQRLRGRIVRRAQVVTIA